MYDYKIHMYTYTKIYMMKNHMCIYIYILKYDYVIPMCICMIIKFICIYMMRHVMRTYMII